MADELERINQALKALEKDFHQSLLVQERRFTVQDSIITILTEIKEAIRTSEKEIKHLLKNVRIELDATDQELERRISVLERENQERKISWLTVKTMVRWQWGVVGFCFSSLIAIVSLHLQRLL